MPRFVSLAESLDPERYSFPPSISILYFWSHYSTNICDLVRTYSCYSITRMNVSIIEEVWPVTMKPN